MGRLRASAGGRGTTSLSLIHPEAIYDINFASGQWFGALPSDLVVSRASEALTLTPGDTYANFASNTARITGNGLMIEEARMNSIRNPRGSGAVVGTPGTFPAATIIGPVGNVGTLATSVAGVGLESGLQYFDLKISGTPSGPGYHQVYWFTDGAALTGQTWVASAYIKLASGTLTGVNFPQLYINELTAGEVFVTNGSALLSINSNPLAECVKTYTRTLSGGATVGKVAQAFTFEYDGTAAIDVALRIAAPLLHKGTFAGSPILNADGVTSSATTQPADVVYLPISGVGLEYTIYAQTAVLASHVSSGALIEAWASSSDRIRPNISQATQGGSVTSGGSSRSISAFTAGSGAARKVAMRVQGGNIIVACNGSLGTADTGAAPVVAPSQLYFGSGAGGTAAFLNDELLRGAIIPRALPDAELQALTSG